MSFIRDQGMGHQSHKAFADKLMEGVLNGESAFHSFPWKDENAEPVSRFRAFLRANFLRESGAHPATKIYRLIHPQSYFYIMWSFSMSLILLVISFTIPLRMSFASDDDACSLSASELIWQAWDLICDTLFMLDLILNFFVCAENEETVTRDLIDDRVAVARMYFTGKTGGFGGFFFDLAKCFPVSYLQIALVERGACGGNLLLLQFLKILRGLRILRLLRLTNIKRALSAVTVHSSVIRNHNMIRLVKMVFLLMFSVHCVACIWWFVKRQESDLKEWLVTQNVRDNDLSRYLTCFYFAVSTLFTVGYGDISGHTDRERLTACLFMIFGGLLFATVISHISALSVSLSQKENELELRKADVISFLQGRKVPLELQKRVALFMDRFSQSMTEGPEALDSLPASLKFQLLEVMAQQTMERVHIFKNMPSPLLMQIYLKLIPLRCGPGEVLIREGAVGREMFFIMQGSVFVTKNKLALDELFSGDIFGEMSVLADQRRNATVITKDYSELFVLEKHALEEVLARFPGALAELMKRAEYLQQVRDRLLATRHSSHPELRQNSFIKKGVNTFVSNFRKNKSATVAPASNPGPVLAENEKHEAFEREGRQETGEGEVEEAAAGVGGGRSKIYNDEATDNLSELPSDPASGPPSGSSGNFHRTNFNRKMVSGSETRSPLSSTPEEGKRTHKQSLFVDIQMLPLSVDTPAGEEIFDPMPLRAMEEINLSKRAPTPLRPSPSPPSSFSHLSSDPPANHRQGPKASPELHSHNFGHFLGGNITRLSSAVVIPGPVIRSGSRVEFLTEVGTDEMTPENLIEKIDDFRSVVEKKSDEKSDEKSSGNSSGNTDVSSSELKNSTSPAEGGVKTRIKLRGLPNLSATPPQKNGWEHLADAANALQRAALLLKILDEIPMETEGVREKREEALADCDRQISAINSTFARVSQK